MTYEVKFDREKDGRWIADVPALPGVMCYGATKEEARERAQALACRVVAERRFHQALDQFASTHQELLDALAEEVILK